MMEEHDFQQKTKEKLKEGKSILIIAPTGMGKTRAALKPFIIENTFNPLLTTRLIYTLPLRSLAQGVIDEFRMFHTDFQPIIHHGDEPESMVFSEQAIVTTVDQYFTAFAGAPLSWASHMSHAAAGAILTSYSVFDEVHLLSPKTGLQMLFAILRLRQRWGLFSCVMTATLPKSVINFFKEFCGLEVVEATKKDISYRDSWRKVRLQLLGRKNSDKRKFYSSSFKWEEKDPQDIAELVKEKWEGWDQLNIDDARKIIVFVNTVDRAIEVYKKLQKLCHHVVIAHSRFTKDDRKKVESQIQQFFGKEAHDIEAILITTQVAEAGVNISAPLVITELCPIDSLIQRVGRCQRFKPKKNQEIRGFILVVKPKVEGKTKWHIPYMDSIIVQKNKNWMPIPIAEVSRYILEKHFTNDGFLDWNVEKAIINDALSDIYEVFLKGVDRFQYTDIKEKSLGKVYQQLKKNGTKETEEIEEYEGEETEE
jgi:CRISPR-associated endonuclease/helicase Cas3